MTYSERLRQALEARLNPESDARRMAVLYVTPEVILNLCQEGKHLYEVTGNALPADARLVRFNSDRTKQRIALVLRSASFKPVEPGATMPELPSPEFRHFRGEVVAIHNPEGEKN